MIYFDDVMDQIGKMVRALFVLWLLSAIFYYPTIVALESFGLPHISLFQYWCGLVAIRIVYVAVTSDLDLD